MHIGRMSSLVVLASVLFCPLAAVEWKEADFESIGSGFACPAKVAFRKDERGLTVAVEVGTIPGNTSAPQVMVGVGATSSKVLTASAGDPGLLPGWHRATFTIDGKMLARSEAEWVGFRFAAAVSFPGTVNGQPLYRMRYRHLDGRAMHSVLSAQPQDWQAFDLTAYRQRVSDRGARVTFAFDQPLTGKATIVIDDAQGNRIRNLVSGRPFVKGKQSADWDLLDDNGKVVTPGTYTWRSLHHEGITPEYQFSYDNDGNPPWKNGSGTDMWGPDHSCINAVATCKDDVFFLSPCAEAGYQGAITDLKGIKHQTWGTPCRPSSFILASNGTHVFAAADDGSRQLLLRYKTGADWEAFGNGQREIEWGTAAMNGFGKDGGTFSQADWKAFNLAGFGLVGERLAVASREKQELIFFSSQSGERLSEMPLPNPGAVLGLVDGSLLAISNGAILKLAAKATSFAPFKPAGALKPGAMASDGKGLLYVVDEATSQVVLLDLASGSERGRLGKPGGTYAGKYDPERMIAPTSLAIASNGWLWVTENRFNPKRAVAWDLASKKIVKEKFGSTSYGASGGGIDSEDPTRFIGQGAIWHIDLAKKTAVPSSILFADPNAEPSGYHWRFVRRDGRTFLLGYSSANSVVELQADGSGKLLAQYGSAQGYCIGMGANVPAVFLDRFYTTFGFDTPEQRKVLHEGKWPHQNIMFVWSDRSGDGAMQADELEFTDRAGGGYWGADVEGLDIVTPLFKDQGNGHPANWRLDLPLLGWYPSGAPRWKPLAEGLADAKPSQPEHWGAVSALCDRRGRMYVNSSPQILAYSPEGNLQWTYPNNWAGVHGSHDAPLPSPGQLQGALFFLGNAPLTDGKTDALVINGNHGRFFALTSDGFYLDEFFKDVRMGSAVDAYLIGGECFGGSFVRGSDKRYYLLSGHTDYRIFTMRGFESIVRGPGGSVTVTPAQIEAADRRTQFQVAEGLTPATGSISKLAMPPSMDGSGAGWPKVALAKWTKSGKFPIEVFAGWDASHLYLRWVVQEASPWSNHGGDSNLLFKTGDSVDLQIGTDPTALANRTAPVPGDIRLLIAPFKGEATAVLYRHRVPGTTKPVPFSSPWRTENVDVVQRLDTVKLNVATGEVSRNVPGYVVEAAIPLTAIGLKPELGRDYRMDLGAIFGDPDGQMNQLRSYWSNQATGLVNDVPGEIMLFPATWGSVRFVGDQ